MGDPMKVLYITGSCLHCNTSANMSHNSYLQGFIENGCEVDVIMSDRGILPIDENMPVFKDAKYYTFKSISVSDAFKDKVKMIIDRNAGLSSVDSGISGNSIRYSAEHKNSYKLILRKILKDIYNFITHSEYPYKLSKEWIKNASQFSNNIQYELVVSNSCPESSHALAYNLLDNKKVKCKKWIQIWEDPWYYDLYNTRKETSILKEETKLLTYGDEIYYVSPLTLKYQKKYFPYSADKMRCIPLPYLKVNDVNSCNNKNDKCIFGYFGDYYSYVRNLRPFYDAIKELEGYANIYGDNNENFSPTDKIVIENRVSIGQLNRIISETDVLIMLCNLKGGQIPGKIYHYSATNKPIIFILDGTEDEKNEIYNYFNKFNRYIFCSNNKQDITRVLTEFMSGKQSKQSVCVDEFSPKSVVKRILYGE